MDAKLDQIKTRSPAAIIFNYNVAVLTFPQSARGLTAKIDYICCVETEYDTVHIVDKNQSILSISLILGFGDCLHIENVAIFFGYKIGNFVLYIQTNHRFRLMTGLRGE